MVHTFKINKLHLRNLRGDFFGGLTAAIVALPLALAFGVSSGAGATAGLYGAIATGFFAALFGGTPAQISGPTGPMTVVMATVSTALIAKYPESGPALAFTVVMLGGAFQIVLGLLRLGEYITLMPYTVISGFMSGIGAIIFVLQLAPLFGQAGSASVTGSLQQLPEVLAQPNVYALGLGLLTLAVKKLTDEQNRYVQAIVSPTDDTLTEAEQVSLAAVAGRVLLFRLSGPMSFGAAKTISQQMSIVNKFEVLILDLVDVPKLGVTASLAVENMVRDSCAQRRLVYLVGAKGLVKDRLSALEVLDILPPENILTSRLEAIERAAQSLKPSIYHSPTVPADQSPKV